MTKREAVGYLVETIAEYILNYAESSDDIRPLTGEEGGHRPDRKHVALLATALRSVGKKKVAERLESLCK